MEDEMSFWTVEVPITGKIVMTVEATSEKDACKKALETEYNENEHELSWNQTSVVVEGNVCHADLNRIFARKQK